MAKEEAQLPRWIPALIYATLGLLGVFFYVMWGIKYSSWNIFDKSNMGVYAISVLMVLSGIIGTWLFGFSKEAPVDVE